MPCETCLHERELDDIKKDIERNWDDKKDIYDRLNTLEQSSATTRTDLTYIKNGIDGLRTSVDELQKKPSKRWDGNHYHHYSGGVLRPCRTDCLLCCWKII